jgi:hypothetical protein
VTETGTNIKMERRWLGQGGLAVCLTTAAFDLISCLYGISETMGLHLYCDMNVLATIESTECASRNWSAGYVHRHRLPRTACDAMFA